MWAEIPHPPLHYGAFKPLNYCSWATYAKLMEDSGQCMEIWLATTEGDITRVDEFIHMYYLKESKEYG